MCDKNKKCEKTKEDRKEYKKPVLKKYKSLKKSVNAATIGITEI